MQMAQVKSTWLKMRVRHAENERVCRPRGEAGKASLGIRTDIQGFSHYLKTILKI